MTIKVGATVWVFDVDRRIYPKPEAGRTWASGGPIYREHFVPRLVVGETSRSWILSCRTKVDKKTLESARDSRGYRKRIYNEAQVDDACFLNDERRRISEDVAGSTDVGLLRRIDELLKAARR